MIKVKLKYGFSFLGGIILLFIQVVFLPVDSVGQSDDAIKRCATMEAYWFGQRTRVDSITPLDLLNRRVNQYLKDRRRQRKAEFDVINIPVVVHVIHNQPQNIIGGSGNPNISEEQIRSQIRILNEDYRKLPGSPGYNEHPAGVDTKISFYLADFDPNGAATNGITRTYYEAKSTFNPYTDAPLLANIISWPTDQYLNIWVCALSGNYLGVAQFPSVSGVPGLDNNQANQALTDGVIIDYRSFGDRGAVQNNDYNQGRTATHEIGHWLGLLHIWGDARCGDDYCDDTPWAESSNTTSCNERFSNCRGTTSRNMIENYMDYSPDRCMNIFTFNQMERMHAVLELSPRRASLVANARKLRLEESEQLQVRVFPNPIVGKELKVEVRHQGFKDVEIAIADLQGKIYSVEKFTKIWSREIVTQVGNLTRGVYLVIVTNESGEKQSSKFVVN